MAVTRPNFYVRFKEFDLTDTVNPGPDTVQDALVDAALVASEDHHDRTLFKTVASADEAIMYYTAHLLARAPFAVNARIQKSRGDQDLVTGEDIYHRHWMTLIAPAAVGRGVL